MYPCCTLSRNYRPPPHCTGLTLPMSEQRHNRSVSLLFPICTLIQACRVAALSPCSAEVFRTALQLSARPSRFLKHASHVRTNHQPLHGLGTNPSEAGSVEGIIRQRRWGAQQSELDTDYGQDCTLTTHMLNGSDALC